VLDLDLLLLQVEILVPHIEIPLVRQTFRHAALSELQVERLVLDLHLSELQVEGLVMQLELWELHVEGLVLDLELQVDFSKLQVDPEGCMIIMTLVELLSQEKMV